MQLDVLLTQILIIASGLAFFSGLLITAVTGSARPVKVLLAVLGVIVALAVVGGLIFSRGLLVYLLFQIISLVLLLFFVVVLGAVCGGGIYMLLHRRTVGKSLGQAELQDYLPLAGFSTLEGITEERALSRIKSGLYGGGRYEGKWYIHKSELSASKTVAGEAN